MQTRIVYEVAFTAQERAALLRHRAALNQMDCLLPAALLRALAKVAMSEQRTRLQIGRGLAITLRRRDVGTA